MKTADKAPLPGPPTAQAAWRGRMAAERWGADTTEPAIVCLVVGCAKNRRAGEP